MALKFTPRTTPSTATLITVLVFAIYAGVTLITSLLMVNSVLIGKIDTALYQNTLWQAGQFKHPLVYITYAQSGVPTHPLTGLHFMPIGFLYGLIYRVFPGYATTAVLTTLFFTAAGVFVYLSARHVLKNYLAAWGITLVYLLNFTPIAAHPYPIEDWSAAYVALGLYLVLQKQYRWASLAFLLVVMSKEYFGLAIAAYGLATLLVSVRNNRSNQPQNGLRRWAWLWFVGGIIWFAFGFFGIMRLVEPNWINEYMFQSVGGSVTGVVDTLRSNPLFIVQRLLSPVGVRYIAGILIPYCFVSLFGLEYMAALLPIVLINFLADPSHTVAGVVEHYTTWLLPFVAVGAAVGLNRLVQISSTWPRPSHQWVRQGGTVVIGLVFSAAIVSGAIYFGFQLRSAATYSHTLSEHTRDVHTVFTQIPESASVAGQEFFLPQLANRLQLINLDKQGKNITVFSPDYILCDALTAADIASVQAKAKSLGLSLFNTSPAVFYDSQAWEQRQSDPCPYERYVPEIRQGSVVLYRRQP